MDPAALAAFINAEAAKDKDGVCQADSAASTSSAKGLMQFLKRTWQNMATTPGTLLNQTAVERGLIKATPSGSRTTYSVAPGQTEALQDLRTDPQLSITTGAEYLKQNLSYLDVHGAIPSNVTADQKARLGYIAHHEGASGAVDLLNGNLSPDKAQALMDGNMSTSQQRLYFQAYNNDKVMAYKAFVQGYAKKQVNPDRYRCDKG